MQTTNSFDQFASATELEAYLVEKAKQQYGDLFGQKTGGFYYGYPEFVDAVPLAAPTIDVASGSASKVSSTNTQVDGVDEADLVETDGRFIYQVNGQLLTIVDAQDESDLTIASQFSLGPWIDADDSVWPADTAANSRIALQSTYLADGTRLINGMYLQGDRLTVISSEWLFYPAAGDAIYPYWGYPGNSEVEVTVFDVTDPTDVSVVESSTLEGSLVSSRALGDDVFVVTSNDFQLPPPKILPTSDSESTLSNGASLTNGQAVADIAIYPPYPPQIGTYETEAEYLDRIKGQILDLGLPNVETVDGAGKQVDSGLLTDVTDIYKPLDDRAWQLTTVSTFDVGDDDLGVDASTSIPTDWVGQTYVSADYLYLIRETYQKGKIYTDILQFDLEDSELVAQGQVPGHIDSQFSVDEHDGFLRVTTTTGFGNKSGNNLYVLKKKGASLDVVGEVENLAPGEQIFSTRFQGDYGFVVTFRQVDPLFTFDLSNPRSPKVMGELKIPGFSEYLQVIEDGNRTLLLGVGRDADPTTGRAEALKVSLFDVTDLDNPQEVDSYIFEGDFTSSEALWDHHAITYSPEHKLLAIPTNSYSYDDFSDQSNLHVFRVDGRQGLTSLGEVDHGGDDWINRSLYIDDTLFAVSNQQISAHRIPTLDTLSEVKWSGNGVGVNIFAPSVASTLAGGERDDSIVGSAGKDVLMGKEGHDRIQGGAGDDRINGDDGEDRLSGGQGNDLIKGGAGDDVLLGKRGNDRLLGGSGNDQLVGGAGKDRLNGGAGSDVLSGGRRSDRFIFKKLKDSVLSGYDVITDLVIGKDKIDGAYKVSAEDVLQLGDIDDLTRAELKSVLTRSTFVRKGAATFTVNNQTFLALNNNVAGFQPKRDAIIRLSGFTGDLADLKIV